MLPILQLCQHTAAQQMDTFGGIMRNRCLGVAALLFVGVITSTGSANAVAYLYEINAFGSQCGLPAGAANSITGSFTMDDSCNVTDGRRLL